MADPQPKAPEQEQQKNPDEVTPKAPETTPEAPKPEEKKEPTVSEVLPTADPKPEPKKPDQPESVPLATFLEVKKDNKELREALTALEKKVDAGAPKVDVAEDIAALGEEFGVDKQFLARLTGAIQAKVKGEAAAEVQETLRPIQEKERKQKVDEAFNTHFNKAMEAMPEFKDIVNAEVIKTLSLDPKNKDKTFRQLIEETYGNAIPGKRSIETTTPGGGKESEPIDYARAAKDQTYLAEILKDPVKKAEYNKDLTKRLRL